MPHTLWGKNRGSDTLVLELKILVNWELNPGPLQCKGNKCFQPLSNLSSSPFPLFETDSHAAEAGIKPAM